MGRFIPGARISQAHGTMRPADPATGARDALVFAMYHPAAALRTPAIERDSYGDMAQVPTALIASRERRAARERTAVAAAVGVTAGAAAVATAPDPEPEPTPAPEPEPPPPSADLVPTDQMTLFQPSIQQEPNARHT
jgi:hypothetical protein